MSEAKTVYKLVRLKKDGNCYPLFINKTTPFKFGQWVAAEFHPTKGFAERKGYHCCYQPVAPHLKEELKTGEKRVWIECLAHHIERYERPESQGGAWCLCQLLYPERILTWDEVRELQTVYRSS